MPSKHVTKFRGHKKKIDKLQACFLLWKIFKDVILSTAAWVKGQQTGQAADRLKKPRRNCGKKVLSVRNSLY